MASHTARYASVLALWGAVTHDLDAIERARRSFNWATYFSDGSGHVAVVDEPFSVTTAWYSDSYGDYIRHFLSGMATVPAWAPPGENHLLGTSSVVRSIRYETDAIRYETFDSTSQEVLRVTRDPKKVWAADVELPRDVASNGYSIVRQPEGDYVLTVSHTGATALIVDFTGNAGPSSCSTATGPAPWAGVLVLVIAAVRGSRRRPARGGTTAPSRG
jgi:uncharacterized protein (TIGR03382 family)